MAKKSRMDRAIEKALTKATYEKLGVIQVDCKECKRIRATCDRCASEQRMTLGSFDVTVWSIPRDPNEKEIACENCGTTTRKVRRANVNSPWLCSRCS